MTPGHRVKTQDAPALAGVVVETGTRRGKVPYGIVEFGDGQRGEYHPDKLALTRIGETVRVVKVREGASASLRGYIGRSGTIVRERGSSFSVEIGAFTKMFFEDEIEVVG